jgi:hypothetical protein
MSFTQWLTMSCPTVSCRPAHFATFSFVPTPSMLLTNTQSLPGDRNMPPKEPQCPSTLVVIVWRIILFARLSARILTSMSTPAAA